MSNSNLYRKNYSLLSPIRISVYDMSFKRFLPSYKMIARLRCSAFDTRNRGAILDAEKSRAIDIIWKCSNFSYVDRCEANYGAFRLLSPSSTFASESRGNLGRYVV